MGGNREVTHTKKKKTRKTDVILEKSVTVVC